MCNIVEWDWCGHVVDKFLENKDSWEWIYIMNMSDDQHPQIWMVLVGTL